MEISICGKTAVKMLRMKKGLQQIREDKKITARACLRTLLNFVHGKQLYVLALLAFFSFASECVVIDQVFLRSCRMLWQFVNAIEAIGTKKEKSDL